MPHNPTAPAPALADGRLPDRRRSLPSAAVLLLLTGCAVGLSACGSGGGSAPGEGGNSGAVPATAASLYSGPAPRPGPDILYAPPPEAPQLENAGPWRAEPILISGASAYRDGEFLYQDYLYDDHGAGNPAAIAVSPADPGFDPSADLFSRPGGSYRYPTDPVFANNAADLVEVRFRAADDATLLRLTLNTLNDPERVAFTLALGDSGAPREMPRGANTQAPAAFFVTASGGFAEMVDAASGAVLTPAPEVSVDLRRRQITLRIPRATWDPGRNTVPARLAVGLWDPVAQRYLVPQAVADAASPGGALSPAPSAFFNAAFRFAEPSTDLVGSAIVGDLLLTPAWWRNQQQAAALADGDLTPLVAQVDFARLRDGVDDDMPDTPTGVPSHGAINRIFASRFETAPGVDFARACGEADGCRGILGGQLQPYALYVPDKPVPEDGYGFTLLMHSLAANYNQYDRTRHQRELGERGRGHLVATPAGRGPDGWYVDLAGADAFEVWADVARHYPLDPDLAVASGVSMGGYGSYRFASRFPDLFSRIHTIVGPPAVGVWVPPLQPSPGPASNTFELMPSLRNIPVLQWVALTDELVPYPGPLALAQELDRLGYRYDFRTFAPAEHLSFSFSDEYGPAIAFLGEEPIHRNPHRITYIVNPPMDFPEVGMRADHAYWLSGLQTVDGQPGRVDAFSHGFGLGEPGVSPTQFDAGTLTGGNIPAMAFTSQSRSWSETPTVAAADRLTLELSNIEALTVHPERARLSCDAELAVQSDTAVTVTLAGCGRVARFPPG